MFELLHLDQSGDSNTSSMVHPMSARSASSTRAKKLSLFRRQKYNNKNAQTETPHSANLQSSSTAAVEESWKGQRARPPPARPPPPPPPPPAAAVAMANRRPGMEMEESPMEAQPRPPSATARRRDPSPLVRKYLEGANKNQGLSPVIERPAMERRDSEFSMRGPLATSSPSPSPKATKQAFNMVGVTPMEKARLQEAQKKAATPEVVSLRARPEFESAVNKWHPPQKPMAPTTRPEAENTVNHKWPIALTARPQVEKTVSPKFQEPPKKAETLEPTAPTALPETESAVNHKLREPLQKEEAVEGRKAWREAESPSSDNLREPLNENEPPELLTSHPEDESPIDDKLRKTPKKEESEVTAPTAGQPEEISDIQDTVAPQIAVPKESTPTLEKDNPTLAEPAQPTQPKDVDSPPRQKQPTAEASHSPSPLSLSSPQHVQREPLSQKDEAMPAPPQFDEPKTPVPLVVTTPAKTLPQVSTPNMNDKTTHGALPTISSPSTAATSTASTASEAPLNALAPTTSAASQAAVNALALIHSKHPTQENAAADLVRTDLWSKDESVVHNALMVITKEAAGSDKSRSLIARTGGLFAVVKAMETHSTSAEVQISGCQALEKLALDSDNEIAIEQVGGIETILAAMMSHFENSTVHEAAWAALWNLTCSNASKELTLDADGGMNAILSAQRAHMNSPEVQKNACGALSNLCQNNPKRMEAFAEADGFVVVATAMQKYWSLKDVRGEACHAMTVLCEGFATRSSPTKSTAITVSPVVPSSNTVNNRGGYLPGGYMPHRLGAMAQTLNNHGYHPNMANDLQSIASGMSYYDEETVYD
mmetsp:Transcript_6154/g.12653  ORF Transcript_6154/g.12653 Transcript_6154/m.12653 type:complete len:826 (+) Transcript_6154:394-2871(+)